MCWGVVVAVVLLVAVEVSDPSPDVREPVMECSRKIEGKKDIAALVDYSVHTRKCQRLVERPFSRKAHYWSRLQHIPIGLPRQ